MHIKTIQSYHVITTRNSHLKNQSQQQGKKKQETSVGEDVQNWNTVDGNAK